MKTKPNVPMHSAAARRANESLIFAYGPAEAKLLVSTCSPVTR